jgi:uncharacterized protein (DUF983 family)
MNPHAGSFDPERLIDPDEFFASELAALRAAASPCSCTIPHVCAVYGKPYGRYLAPADACPACGWSPRGDPS